MSVVVPGSGGQRYVKMFGRSTSCLLAPSEISYSYPMNGEQGDLQGWTTEQEDTIAASLLLYRLPKMQVTEKGGRWFALNNASLRLFRRLEYEGKCSKVSAEVVPLSKVPPKVREAMANAPLPDSRDTAPPSPAFNARLQPRNQILGTKSKFRDRTGNKADDEEEEESGQATKKGYHKVVCPGRHLDDDDDTASSRNGDDDITSSSCTEDDDEDSQDLEVAGGIVVEDDSEGDFEDDDALTCNVCDRTFSSGRQMARHQQRRRHFWCSVCETLFPALTALERHKQSLDHWSDEEDDEEDEEDDEEDDANETDGDGAKERTVRGEMSEDDETSTGSEVRRKSGEQERLL